MFSGNYEDEAQVPDVKEKVISHFTYYLLFFLILVLFKEADNACVQAWF